MGLEPLASLPTANPRPSQPVMVLQGPTRPPSLSVTRGELLFAPVFAEDAWREPEMPASRWWARTARPPHGFALAQRVTSDHVIGFAPELPLSRPTRNCGRPSFGPEIRIRAASGRNWAGMSRIPQRDGEVTSKTCFFSVGRREHCRYSIANLEHHHFKLRAVPAARRRACAYVRPATLSFAEGMRRRRVWGPDARD